MASGSGIPAPGALARRLLRNTGIAVRDSVSAPFAWRVPRDWIVVRLDRGLVDVPTAREWLDAIRPQPRALNNVVDALERASGDARVHGVLLRVGRSPLGWSRLATLERAVLRLREAGKLCVVYAERTGNAGAWLGALADQFWMTPEGSLDLVGVRADSPFLRELLDRFHVRSEVVHAGRYKSAGEIVDRSGLSDEAREALDAVVERLYDALVEGLRRRNGASAEQARRWIDEGPYLAGEALEAGLVDALCYGDELPGRLQALAPGDHADASEDGDAEEAERAHLLGEQAYLRVSRRHFDFDSLLEPRADLAVVPVQGLIRSPEHSARPVVALLRRLAEDRDVQAVVLRIDSPGGDPLASDLIWRAVGKLREKKPVVASMGDAAASGGYYVAMAANEIVAERTTLTGSIGVVLMGLVFQELLEHIGIRFDGVARGRHAGIYDPYRQRSDEERELLARQVERMYRSFVAKAAAGRDRDVAEIEEVAEGRVWTGGQAHERGLVDHLGGLDTALERACALAGLAPGAGRPVYLAPSVPLLQRLRSVEPLGAHTLVTGISLLCPISIPLR